MHNTGYMGYVYNKTIVVWPWTRTLFVG